VHLAPPLATFAGAHFARRTWEPEQLGPYRELLDSPRVRRVYLDDLPISADPPVGLGILQLASAPLSEAPALVSKLLDKAEHEWVHFRSCARPRHAIGRRRRPGRSVADVTSRC
jgi:Protein of unknown function (DUF2887)